MPKKTGKPEQKFEYKGWSCAIRYREQLNRFVGNASKGNKLIETSAYHHDFNALTFLKARIDLVEAQ